MKKKSKKGKVKDEAKQLKTEEVCLLFSDSDEEMEKHCISKEIANIVDSGLLLQLLFPLFLPAFICTDSKNVKASRELLPFLKTSIK